VDNWWPVITGSRGQSNKQLGGTRSVLGCYAIQSSDKKGERKNQSGGALQHGDTIEDENKSSADRKNNSKSWNFMSSWKSREMDRGGGGQSIWEGVVTWHLGGAEDSGRQAGQGRSILAAAPCSFPLPYQERLVVA
jgi:hypothetical protein